LIVVAVDEPVEGHVASLSSPWLKRTNIGADKQVSAGLVQKMHSVLEALMITTIVNLVS